MDDQRDFAEEAFNQRILDTGDGEIEAPALECLDGPEGCRGAVEYRMALSPSGRAFPRCDFHWEKRLDKEESSFSWRSDVPPAWFDPSYAGESWDED